MVRYQRGRRRARHERVDAILLVAFLLAAVSVPRSSFVPARGIAAQAQHILCSPSRYHVPCRSTSPAASCASEAAVSTEDTHITWACDWKYYLNRIPKHAAGAVSNIDDDPETQEYWESPMGIIRKHFLSTQGLYLKPNRKRLPPWTETALVVPHQIERDIEQFEYLVSNGLLEPHVEKYVINTVIPEFQNTLAFAKAKLATSGEFSCTLHYQKQFAAYFALHQRAVHLHPGNAVSGDAISPRDFELLQREYLQQAHRAMVIDDFLSPEALEELHRFLLESTFWLDAHEGYVGTYLHTAFASPLIAQIDRELRTKLPEVLGGLELRNAWAYMFDGSLGGIATHADDAQVQINIFLTPTEANLWSSDSTQPTGGLVIFGIGPGGDWDLPDMNGWESQPRIAERIASTGNWNVTVPYVQNRAILFDSTYFHRTDDMKFQKGYTNRRINVTFLYGRRGKLVAAPTMKPR